MTLAEQYGEFITALTWRNLDPDVRQKTLDLTIDWMGNAAAGLDSKIGRALSAAAPGTALNRHSLLLGSLEKTGPLTSALINGAACHVLEFDDAFRKGLFHPGAPIISAAWAAAGLQPVPGPRFLSGVVAGYEVAMRIAEAVNPAHNRTWHTTGTVGTLGAAAAAAHCLELNARECTAALGLAGTQAAGLWEILPDAPEAKGLHTGRAAQSGLMAALLAQKGIPGPPGILEGPRGMFNSMVAEPVDPDICLSGLGEEWRLPETTIKAYPVCGHTMTAIEAALKLAKEIQPDQIQSIEILAHPVSAGVAGILNPGTIAEAKFSIPFCTALALVRRQVVLSDFTPATLDDPVISRLLSVTELKTDTGLTNTPGLRPAKVTLCLADGRRLTRTEATRKGDPENPLNPNEIKTKFMELSTPVWGRQAAESVFTAVDSLPQAQDILQWQTAHLLSRQNRICASDPALAGSVTPRIH